MGRLPDSGQRPGDEVNTHSEEAKNGCEPMRKCVPDIDAEKLSLLRLMRRPIGVLQR